MEYTPLWINGVFVDNTELFGRNVQGRTHVCECRQNHDAFFNRSEFMKHIKLKCHQKWVASLEPPTISPLYTEPLSLPPLSLPPLSLPPLSLPPLSLPPLSLRAEQDDEYERTLKEDRRKVDDKLNAILKESEEQYKKEQEKRERDEAIDKKRKSIVSEKGYTLRLIFPNGKKVSHTIHKSRQVAYMRDIVDVYMADNENIFNYDLFIFPNVLLNSSDTIEESGIENRNTIYIREIE
jgi:hypothetical protein